MDNKPILTSIQEANAPWHEKKEYDGLSVFKCTETLSKDVTIPNDVDVAQGCRLKEAYNEWHFSIQDLLAELKSYIEYDMSMTAKNTTKYGYLTRMLADCSGWVSEDVDLDFLGRM